MVDVKGSGEKVAQSIMARVFGGTTEDLEKMFWVELLSFVWLMIYRYDSAKCLPSKACNQAVKIDSH